MSTKPKRILQTFELSASAKATLNRIKKVHGLTKVAAVERGIVMLENTLTASPLTKATK